jgi:crotonobetainyl-CoA:carnitine CoA-transferase CaiB-like acyl-CoA transferase
MGAPLDGLRVLELGEALAGPLTCTLLADFGADVVKVERPGRGDSMRTMGPQVDGVGLWWTVTGRGKRSVAVDLKSTEGRDIVQGLAAGWADIVVENFRPGVLERYGLGWDDLHPANPALIMVRISGFGQTGPYSKRRGFGKIAEGFSGATNLTGDPDAAPVQPGYSLGDATTAAFGVIGALLAVIAKYHDGVGQLVDIALYEGLLRLIEWQLPLAAHTDINVTRNGNAFPFDDAFITDIVACADGESVIYSAATAVHLARLRTFLGSTAATEGLATSAGVVRAVRAWAATTGSVDALETLTRADLVAGAVYTPQQLLTDPHLRARDNIVTVEHPRLGPTTMPGVVPRLSATPGAVTRPAPDLGADTVQVLTDILHLSPADVDRLLAAGHACEPASDPAISSS